MNLSANNLLKGRYRIESVLGQGGMGAVYKATDELLGIPVAVKENLFLSEEYTLQFKQETRILASLRHHSLPRVLDFYSIEGQGQYLVMDYIGGEDLRGLLKRSGPLSEQDVVLIGFFICEALEYMHSQDPMIVHRDVKPGNIKLTSTNEVYLVDFGLAKQTSSRSQMTMTGARAMTPGFSPPEQYGTARTDERSDIYSLGATLYNALTGAVPEDALDRVTDRNDLTPILDHRRDTERRLVRVIEKAMALNPEDRYQSASEFQDALLYAARMQSIRSEISQLHHFDFNKTDNQSSEKKSPQPSAMKKSKRRTLFPTSTKKWLEVAFLTMVILAFIGLLSVQSTWLSNVFYPKDQLGEDPIALLAATLTFTDAPSTPNDPTFTKAIPSSTPMVATDSPQPTIIGTLTSSPSATTPDEGTVTLTVSHTIQPTAIQLVQGIQDLFPIVFASNRNGTNQLWLMDELGEEQFQLTNMPAGACQPDWSPDGQRIIFISPCRLVKDEYTDSILYVYTFEDKSIVPLLEIEDVSLKSGNFDPDWSLDGSYVVFTSLREGISFISKYSLSEKAMTVLTSDEKDSFQPAWHPDSQSIIFVRDRSYASLWQISIDGIGLMQITDSGNVDNYHPVWDPEGRFILYSQLDRAQVPWLVKLFEGNFGTNVEDRIRFAGVTGAFPVLAPVFQDTNDMIIFESWPDGTNHDIYSVNIDGTGLKRLTTSSSYDFDPDYYHNRIVIDGDGENEP